MVAVEPLIEDNPQQPRRRVRRPRAPEIVELAVLPVRDRVLYPQMVTPLPVGRPGSLRAIEYALAHDQTIFIVAQKDPEQDEVGPNDLYTVGSESVIGRVLKLPDGNSSVLVQGQRRMKALEFIQHEPMLKVRVVLLPDVVEEREDSASLMKTVLGIFEQCVKLNKNLPEDAYVAAMNVDTPGRLADLIASTVDLDTATRQELLEALDPFERLERVYTLLAKELSLLELESQIQSDVQKEVDTGQREFFLREQVKMIEKELGEIESGSKDIEELKEKITKASMPDLVDQRARKELDRLQVMPSAAPEVGVIRTYLDWLVSLPWSVSTNDRLDIGEAARVLEEHHHGLSKVKERILEYMAVRKLSPKMRSPILCFVGPPGVGKTSLGRSIATALGRKFVRVSLGGVRDEAEIRGHRRTYVGALPGRIIQTMRQAASINPVFMLDEVDKLGMDFRGDPSSALLEVLDPEQNSHFSDHYLEVPYDLSQVIFIATANQMDPIPPPLRDRMEVIDLPGYIEEEKLSIAQRFLVARQLSEHGLTPEHVRFTEGALRRVIGDYTREAGVRNLEREIANICRKLARRVAEAPSNRQAPVGAKGVKAVGDAEGAPGAEAAGGESAPLEPLTPQEPRAPSVTTVISAGTLSKYLGPKHFTAGVAEERDEVGVATGVTWSPVGGDLMSVEVTLLEGKGALILTGQLGETMRESAQAAFSYTRSRSKALNLPESFHDTTDVHIHFPAGGIPKDGPSAGITVATALVSAATRRAVRREVAMTGEITLRGRVLPIGGVKEKVLAAHRAGIRRFILPDRNRKDLLDVPADVQRQMEFIFVDHMDAVLPVAVHEL
ncbi:MAG TPA: endopeptidase La [Chloroflexota bacterium]|nr:endopeptidase La [Chloroflexota bacterium]